MTDQLRRSLQLTDLCGLRDLTAFINAQEITIRETQNLSLMQALTLCALYRRDERKPGVLAELVGLSPSGFSRVLSELESLGYIRRSLSTEDRRNTLVKLTEDGWEKTKKLNEWENRHFPMDFTLSEESIIKGDKG